LGGFDRAGGGGARRGVALLPSLAIKAITAPSNSSFS
jgi:hypothetical protein